MPAIASTSARIHRAPAAAAAAARHATVRGWIWRYRPCLKRVQQDVAQEPLVITTDKHWNDGRDTATELVAIAVSRPSEPEPRPLWATMTLCFSQYSHVYMYSTPPGTWPRPQRRRGCTKVSSRATSSLTTSSSSETARRQCGQAGRGRRMKASTQPRHMAECPHAKRTCRGADMHRMHSRSTLPGALPPPPGAWKDTPGLEGHARLLVSRASRRPRIQCTHVVCARTCQLVAAPA